MLLLSPTRTPAPEETAPPPVPPHYSSQGPGDEYDPALTSPLSPEDDLSEHDSSDGSTGAGVGGDGMHVSRVKEVSGGGDENGVDGDRRLFIYSCIVFLLFFFLDSFFFTREEVKKEIDNDDGDNGSAVSCACVDVSDDEIKEK